MSQAKLGSSSIRIGAKLIVEGLNHLVLKARRHRRVSLPAGTVKVNLGSGLNVAEGWIHVDASPNAWFAGMPRPFISIAHRMSGARKWHEREDYSDRLSRYRFVHHDVRHGIPFPDGSVDYVYSSHMLEHLPRADALTVLLEGHRILKPGGVIRLCVPDLAIAVRHYREGRKQRALEFFYAEEQESARGTHRYLYDFETLSNLLKEAAFERVLRRRYMQGRVPDLAILDNRPDETLFVEAAKTPSSG